MSKPLDPGWIDQRLKDRSTRRKEKRFAELSPSVKIVDASKFPIDINELAQTMIYKLEREGHTVAGLPDNGLEICLILRQIAHTYNLLQFINADDTRFETMGIAEPTASFHYLLCER